MSRSPGRLSLKRALGISTVLHLLLAPLLVTSAAVGLGAVNSSGGTTSTETTRITYLSIERRMRRSESVVAPTRAASQTVASARTPPKADAVARGASKSAAPARKPEDTAKAAPKPARVATGQASPTDSQAMAASEAMAASRAIGRVALTLATEPPERQAPAPAQTTATAAPALARATASAALPAATAMPAPAPTPSATPQVSDAAARGVDAPPGAWGQTFDKPLVADETALADLRSRYHAGSAVTIDVDDAGHATRVTLPNGLSSDVRAEIEKRLRELRYVPAECNGLRCGGTLQITI